MKTVFQKCLCAAAMLFVVSSFSSSASAQSAAGTLPFGGPWGATPGQPFGPMDIRPAPPGLGATYPGLYGPSYPMMGPGFGGGMIVTDPKKAITPRLVAGVTPENSEQRTAELFRSRINIEATANTLRSHISEQQKTVARLTTKLQSAEQKKESTDQIRAEIATVQNENKLFRQALDTTTKNMESVNKTIEGLSKTQQTDNSQGWVVVEPQKNEKGKVIALPLECSSGQRLVSRLQLGTVASFGCLDAKGYLMKESTMILNLNANAHTSATTTVYEREGETIKSITTLDKDGKPTFEKIMTSNQETHKYFDKGAVQSSCTYYGDEASRTTGDGYTRTKTKR